jgi:hypothetical protein
MACLVIILQVSPGHHNRSLGFMSFFWIINASTIVLTNVLVYWDVNSNCLRERRLWHTREVAWSEVTHVGAWNPEQPASDTLAIHYARPAPMSDKGDVIANPDDRQQFIAALRRFAPQATFDV